MIKSISISEISKILSVKDYRTVRRWCEKNNVELFNHGKFEFAIEANFKEVFEKPFIEKLKKKFGKDWESVYNLYSSGNIPALNLLNQNNVVIGKSYQPTNNLVQDYLQKFINHGKTKAA